MRKLLLAVFLAGCQQRVKVEVDCKAVGAKLGEGFTCSLQHVSGPVGAHACWDIDIGCNNGTKGVAPGCGDVDKSARSTTLVPFTAFNHTLDKCDQVTQTSIKNLKITPAK